MKAPHSSSAGQFSVGLVQMSCGCNIDENREKAVQGIREAAGRGAQIICLQELFSTQYFCRVIDPDLFRLSETIPGPTTELFAPLARELNVALVVPVFEKRTAGLYYNSAVVIGTSGQRLGVYRKSHIPDDPHFFEKYYFTPGDVGYRVFDTGFAKVGVLICWDQWYPEAARLIALKGAELIVYPTAIGWLEGDRGPVGTQQLDAWETVQRAHAIANGVYIACANRVGVEGRAGQSVTFWGRSFVCSPVGDVMDSASTKKDEVLVSVCDRAVLENQRREWPFFRDRRIDTYARITERYLDGESDSADR